MNLVVSWRIALRELRGGTGAFRVMLACLAIGVASIAAVGTIRSSIEAGFVNEGARILGGDAELEFTHRFASDAELQWINDTASSVSEIAVFRSLAVSLNNGEPARALTQIKAVDSNYPLLGEVVLDPPIGLEEALTGSGEMPGAVMKPSLATRLGIGVGDTVRYGAKDFRLTALLTSEPDSTGGDVTLGPRTIVYRDSLEGSQLLNTGTLFESKYRMLLAPGTSLTTVRSEAETLFADTGMRWRDRLNSSPGIQTVVDRSGTFLILVGLASLAIGAVGVALAVASYIEAKTPVIASLKALGAQQRTLFTAYLFQTGIVMLLALALGLVVGIGLPLLLQTQIAGSLPVPAEFRIHSRAIVEAGTYGMLVGLVASLWSLAAINRVRAASLFRRSSDQALVMPGKRLGIAILLLATLLVGCIAVFSGSVEITLYFVLGLIGTIAVLVAAAFAVKWLTRKLARSRPVLGHPSLRLALGSLAGPSSGVLPSMLSIGLGLTVLATISQVHSNLVGAISGELPEVAPAFFVIDIQDSQFAEFEALTTSIPGVSRIESAPMLRGVITRINGVPAREVAPNHWVLRGDRGVTHSRDIPEGTVLVEGSWWPADYDGPPLVSFAHEEGVELGLAIGDSITVNILGRDIEVEIASFRDVDFSTAGIGFIMVMSPNALANAPQVHISTVYADQAAEDAVFESVTSAFPNVTAISVREGIANVIRIISSLAAGITYAAGATLFVGFVVMIATTANGVRSRVFEAAVLKVLGATRWTILLSLTLRSVIVGAAAGAVAMLAGAIGGWAVLVFAMEASFRFDALYALAVIVGGIVVSLIAGMAFAYFPLSAKPARVLHGNE